MTQMILAITKQTIDQRDLLQVLEENGIPGLSFISVDTIEDAEPCFFENDILLLIADYNIPGVVEAFMEMKQDEFFAHIPVIMIIPRRTRQAIQTALQQGFDACVAEAEIPLLLPLPGNSLNQKPCLH